MSDLQPVGIIGAGAFGTALANLVAASGTPVFLDTEDEADDARSTWASVARAVAHFEPVTVVATPDDEAIARESLGDHVEVVTVDQITLVLRDQREVLWGSAEESALKAEVVDKLLAAQQASYYDVSVPGNPTYRT